MVEPAPSFDIFDIGSDDARFVVVLDLAASILDQDRYLVREIPEAIESVILGAFTEGSCIGFLRFHTQVIGTDADRPAVIHRGRPLLEGYVDAFGVAPSARRRGIGAALQRFAIDHCRAAGCHQMRSRSPVTSVENYALKLDAGYTLHPSAENDSYYFLLAL